MPSRKTAKLWTRQLGRVVYEAPCSNSPSGLVTFVLMVRSQDPYPEKRCLKCKLMTALPGFLKGPARIEADGYAWWIDDKLCHECDPPEPIELHFDNAGHLHMKMEMHWPDGSVFETWDDKAQKHLPPSEIGLRRMGNGELRLQPYKDRSQKKVGDHTGGQGEAERKGYDVNKFGEKQVRLF
jgi:hypothetical protein